MKLFSLSLLLFSAFNLLANNRPDSKPYLSGDTYRSICTFVLDEDSNFDPISVRQGDTIFVSGETKYLGKFFYEYHPRIKNKYILVTHNSDLSMPGQFKNYLDDPKLCAWFAINVDYRHPKLINIPIGMVDKRPHCDYRRSIDMLIKNDIHLTPKAYLLSANFLINTNIREREPVDVLFRQKPFCYFTPKSSIDEYLVNVCKSKFILSPHGTGLDCHRTWEALYLGVIPVVKTSPLDVLYEDLPVVIVNDWTEVTEEFLEKKYEEMKNKSYKREKLFFNYWANKISEHQSKCRN